VVTQKGFCVDPTGDHIELEGKRLKPAEKYIYLMFNKPRGVVTTVSDERGRETVMDFLPKLHRRIYPVGRLDKDTTGLLLLTSDGELAYRLTHPKFKIDKIYHVQLKGDFSIKAKKQLEKGIFIDGRRTSKAGIKILKHTRQFSILTIKLHEGRKRQVRRMFKKMGFSVIRLKRVAFGNLVLGNLKEGCYRKLTTAELKKLKFTVGVN